MTMPKELEDAAKIDGCSYFKIFWTIFLPLIRPALVTVAIWQFMNSWNDFITPLIYINSDENMTLSLALHVFKTAQGTTKTLVDVSLMMAASALITIPVILVFFFFQKQFIRGITLTGIKG